MFTIAAIYSQKQKQKQLFFPVYPDSVFGYEFQTSINILFNFDFLDSLFQGSELSLLVSQLVSTLGSDATEQACEAECHQLIKADHLLQFGCPLVCKR